MVYCDALWYTVTTSPQRLPPSSESSLSSLSSASPLVGYCSSARASPLHTLEYHKMYKSCLIPKPLLRNLEWDTEAQPLPYRYTRCSYIIASEQLVPMVIWMSINYSDHVKFSERLSKNWLWPNVPCSVLLICTMWSCHHTNRLQTNPFHSEFCFTALKKNS